MRDQNEFEFTSKARIILLYPPGEAPTEKAFRQPAQFIRWMNSTCARRPLPVVETMAADQLPGHAVRFWPTTET